MVDIIVRAKNNHEVSAACLLSIRKNTPARSYRLILSDDGSDPALGDAMTDIYVRSRFCHGAVTATNMGLGAALHLFDNKFVIIMDGETHIRDGDRGWLVRMVETIEAGGEQMACCGVSQDIERPDLWYSPHAAIYRKSVMAFLGPFDEQFNPGMYMHEDYAVRMRISGFTIGVVESVEMLRFDEPMFEQPKRALTAKNQEKFVSKWTLSERNITASEAACPISR